jgi:U3 small nucleolar RNA-associated protein 10
VFLAGVWTSEVSSTSTDKSSTLQEIALRHAAAFLEAHVLENDGMDFQTIIPALLVALQNSASGVRKAAVECLNRVRLISEKKLKSVYKFDVVYGDVQGAFSLYPYVSCVRLMSEMIDTLQYLEQDDLKRYLTFLVHHQEHFLHDPTYLRVAHAEHLSAVRGDRRKEVE